MFCDAVCYVKLTFDTFLFRMLRLCSATLSNIHVLERLHCVHLRYVVCSNTFCLFLGTKNKMILWKFNENLRNQWAVYKLNVFIQYT
jgi:hypothetical protein